MDQYSKKLALIIVVLAWMSIIPVSSFENDILTVLWGVAVAMFYEYLPEVSRINN